MQIIITCQFNHLVMHNQGKKPFEEGYCFWCFSFTFSGLF